MIPAFLQYRQFGVCKLVPKGNGKTDKIPLNPATLEVANAHDPSIWTNYQTAAEIVSIDPSFCATFTFTDNDPFFFIDLDNCAVNGNGWSETAQSVFNALPGAAIEISQSGAGLHIFGTYQGAAPDHGCKNTPLGLEMYTSGRFVALTGNGLTGDAATDCTHLLPGLINQYFPPTASHADVEWRNTPVEGWKGPEDDQALLQLIQSKRSAQAVFGNGVTFNQLWEGDPVALGQRYPAINPNDPYDRSSADAALAQMLAFWTGKNHERIQRMLWMSGLVREKWTGHKKYIGMTVSSAVGRQMEVYCKGGRSKADEEPRKPVEAPTELMVAEPVMTTGDQWMSGPQMTEHFAGCVYVQDLHKMFTPLGLTLKPEQFRSTYGGYDFAINADGSKSTRSAWEAFNDCQVVHFPRVNSTCFRPEIKPGAVIKEEDRSLINLYVPVTINRTAGDIGPFEHHMRLLFPDPRDLKIILCWMAAVVQHPGVKFQWAPLIQGGEGNGKSFIGRALKYAIGSRYTHLPSAAELGDGGLKFNSWIVQKLLIIIEEIFVKDRFEITEPLKILITDDRIEIQAKGVDQYTGDNRAAFLLFTNHKDALPITIDGRRYCIFYTPQQTAEDIARDMPGNYFVDLYNWAKGGGYAHIAHWLMDYQIEDEFNPATKCQRAPKTSSTDEAVHLTMGSVEHAVLEAVEEGRPGFRGGWISSKRFEELLKDISADRKIPINKRRALLQSLGYDWHPHLHNGRVNSVVPAEGVKPRLFIKRGGLLGNLYGAAEILRRYETDQEYPVGFGQSEGVAK